MQFSKYILLECKAFNTTRKPYFQIRNMKDLFENSHMDDVLSFLKETGLYQKNINLGTILKTQPTN